MLDQSTKRKLDSARQILVGKVPDPKAQVEQILPDYFFIWILNFILSINFAIIRVRSVSLDDLIK